MQIRRATAADAQVVLMWLNDTRIWAIDSPGPYEYWTYDQFAPSWLNILANHAVWMLTVEDHVIGQVGWVARNPQVAEFFITIGNSGDRGRGHGRQAMAWLEQQAHRAGLARLVGTVLGNNDKAQSFFQQLGFKLAATWPDQIIRDGKPFALYSFEKDLASR